ncbi:hypothetical protein [Streptomyces sp. GZWMJZ-114]|uniref:hypothetical protein n=1 Tax=Streptomyces sp. GZWMJZ-114 TaxID=2494734 RepID=UPI0013E9277B|nr:hypothetical protein [Streptomyces sp. GZWMJZ-114]
MQLYASVDGETVVDEAFGEASPGTPLLRNDMECGLVVCHLATNKSFQGLGPGRLESRVVRDLYGLVR